MVKKSLEVKNRNLYNIYIMPIDLVLTNLFAIICFIIFFKPSWHEILILYVVDILALFFIQKIGLPLFLKKKPQYKFLLPCFDDDSIARFSQNEKYEFIKSLFNYPHDRTIQVYFLSFIKVLFGGIVIVYFWKNDAGDSISFRWLKFWVIESVGFNFFAGCAFIEFQNSVYEIIKYLKEKKDWSEVISKINPVKSGYDIGTFEIFSLFSISVFIVGLISIYLYNQESISQSVFVITLVILVSGVTFVMRTYYAFRYHFFSSFNEIYNHFQNFSPTNMSFISLHAIPSLTKFEVAYNNLIENLIQRDKALSQWVAFETEQGQVRLLGEITGLVAHDLSGPLNAINFCVEELKEKVSPADLRFLEHLDINVNRINELVESLKSQIKNPYQVTTESVVSDVYSNTMKVLTTQFRSKGLSKIDIFFDINLNGVRLKISRINLGHILYNFLKNSIENLLNNKIEAPSIRIVLKERIGQKIIINFSDNGTGLSKLQFEEMTSLDPLATFSDKRGLGLRLTRRLIENNDGKIVFVEGVQVGTSYDFQFLEL